MVIGDEKQLSPIVTIPLENDFNLFTYGFNEDDFHKYAYSSSSLYQ